MMYEGGWGKKLTYVVSCSIFETVDVTRRYTSKWFEVLQRRLEVPEDWLQRTLAQLNTQLQFQLMLPDYLSREYQARRALEAQQLQQLHPEVSARATRRRLRRECECVRGRGSSLTRGAGAVGGAAATTEWVARVADIQRGDGRGAVMCRRCR